MTILKNILSAAMLPVLCAALALGSCTNDFDGAAQGGGLRPDVTQTTEHEVLVKFSPGVADMLEKASVTRSGPLTRSGVLSVDEVLDIVQGCELERVFPVDAANEERTRASGLNLWYVVRFSGDCTVDEAAERFSQLGEVQKVTPNRAIKRAYDTRRKAVPLTAEAMRRAAVTRAEGLHDDPLLSRQWHLINRGDMFLGEEFIKSVKGADVQCEEAWKLSTGDPSIIVAVLDEGVCVEHPDLRDNMWVNRREVYRSGKDNDGNGYSGDVYGYNFVHDTGIISWDNLYDSGHATHVAGVIAAMNNNGLGISSIAGGTPDNPGVKIMTCQIFSGNLSGGTLAMVRAIKYAADNGAVVLQCSWGYVSGKANVFDYGERMFESDEEWEMYCPLEKEALDYFTHHAGSPDGPIEGGIAVFASGNEQAPMAGYPGAHPDYISVAATAADFTPAIYSNYSTGTSISAPGGDQDYYYEYGGPDDPENGDYGEIGCVLSTLPKNISETEEHDHGYGYMEGTSMACPHVSGVAALGLSYAMQLRKHFSAEEFKRLLCGTATPIDDYMTGSKTFYRYVADLGLIHKMQLPLGSYKGQMGSGQVNAAALLRAIGDDANGRPILFPNLYIALGEQLTLLPANYFKSGESLSYEVHIENTDVAVCRAEGVHLLFEGLNTGTTKARITASDGTEHTFTITVRSGAGKDGWL